MQTGRWALAQDELDVKRQRLLGLLAQYDADSILLRSQQNIFWATAGRADARGLTPGDRGGASLLLMRDGRSNYLTGSNEAARRAEEEFDGSGYTPVVYPWQQNRLVAETTALAGAGRRVLVDTPTDEFHMVNMAPLRTPLEKAEMERYRTLGRLTAEAVSTVLQTLEPGMTERTMEARLAAACRERGLMPSVLLIAADERVVKYRHAVTRDGVLKRYGMLNLCTRKWGLCVSITRYMHLKPMRQALVDRFTAAAKVQASLYDASRPGATAAEIYVKAADAYAAAGFSGEENEHHQGGTAGYEEREWLARPGGLDVLTNDVALAWNPSIQGAKAEDTVLLVDGRIELITATPDLPVVETELNGTVYKSAGVLLR